MNDLGTYDVSDGFDKLAKLAQARKEQPHMKLAELVRYLSEKSVKKLDR